MRTSAALALVVVALAGCGGDDEPSETITTPQLTVPGGDDTQDAAPTETVPAPEPEPPDGDSGGSPAPAPQPAPDSPENDVPPPEGSPAERFEEFCDANPGACG